MQFDDLLAAGFEPVRLTGTSTIDLTDPDLKCKMIFPRHIDAGGCKIASLKKVGDAHNHADSSHMNIVGVELGYDQLPIMILSGFWSEITLSSGECYACRSVMVE